MLRGKSGRATRRSYEQNRTERTGYAGAQLSGGPTAEVDEDADPVQPLHRHLLDGKRRTQRFFASVNFRD
jgi:hypothetical protein